jgi:hypothetical protein
MSERVTRFLPFGFAAAAVLAVLGFSIVPGALARGPGERKEHADNSFCTVCHLNWEKEKFVEKHRREGVGCTDCHGDSDAHMDDEEAYAAPEIMYSRDQINASCMKECHSREKLAREKDHKPLFAGNKKGKVCTDCHGKHRLKERTRRWDTKTGKLLEADGHPVE